MEINSPFERHRLHPERHRLSPLRHEFQPESNLVELSADTHPAEAHEKKTTLGARLKKAASGIIAIIAVEQAAPHLPDLGPAPAVIQTMDKPQTQASAAQQLARPQAQTTGHLDLTPYATAFELPHLAGVDQPAYFLSFPNEISDPIDRIVASISSAQPQPVSPVEAGGLKEVLHQVYHDVIDLLHDHEKVAHVIAEAIVSKAAAAAIEELPECVSAILIALGLKKRKTKEATPSLDQTTADLEKINELYVEGVPLVLAVVQNRLGITAARVRAALQAGLYVEEWQPAGVSLIELLPPTPSAAPENPA
jgi:hypothetical protein